MASNSVSNVASLHLQKQLKHLNNNPVDGFSAGLFNDKDMLRWRITMEGPRDTLYEGGFFTVAMTFPDTYPDKPPKVKFLSKMWHPNVYHDGEVCMSILHPPGDDPDGFELASERWSPVQSVETIMISLMSLLSSPNDASPANIEAGRQWREDKKAYKKMVNSIVRQSQEDFFGD